MSTVANNCSVREAKISRSSRSPKPPGTRIDPHPRAGGRQLRGFFVPIYIRGSVKNYAAALKLDTAAVLAELAAELKETDKFSEPPPLSDSKKTFVDNATLVLAKLNWKVGVAGFALVACGDFRRVVLGVASP